MMRWKRTLFFPRSLTEQPFLASVSSCSSWDAVPSCCCPGPWGQHSWVPPWGTGTPGEAVLPGRGTDGARCSLGLQCRLCCALQSLNTRHHRLCQTGLGPSCSSWRELDTGSSPPSPRGRETEGRGDPLSLVQCLPQSSRETGGECCFILAWELCSLQPH